MSAPSVAPNKIAKTRTIFKTFSYTLFLYSKDVTYSLEVGCNPEDFDQVVQVCLSEIVAKLSRTVTLQEQDLTPLPYAIVQLNSWFHFKLIELVEPEVVKEFKQTEILYSIQTVYGLQHHKKNHINLLKSLYVIL